MVSGGTTGAANPLRPSTPNPKFAYTAGEPMMTRFQRVLMFSAGCGVFAIAIAYLIVVVLH